MSDPPPATASRASRSDRLRAALARLRDPLLLAAALGLLVRMILAWRPLPFLDRLFVVDDAYYTLGIARNLARGLGPTAHGQILTTGFQPLLAWLELPASTREASPLTSMLSEI